MAASALSAEAGVVAEVGGREFIILSITFSSASSMDSNINFKAKSIQNLYGDRTVSNGEWAYLDIGFSGKSRTCGLILGDRYKGELTFGETLEKLNFWIDDCYRNEIHLAIEAPLSALYVGGNPAGRLPIEKRGSNTRYWYAGAGAAVTLATHRLLDQLKSKRDLTIWLYEGFVSFGKKDSAQPSVTGKSSHIQDAEKLQAAIQGYLHGEEAWKSALIEISDAAELISLPQYFGWSTECLPPPVFCIEKS
jgi:hypothetical protein